MPSKTHSSTSSQLVSFSLALRVTFKCLLKHSTRPLACRWYAIMQWSLAPRSSIIAVHSWDVNWAPLSVGRPKRATQWNSCAQAQDLAEVSMRGMASGHRVNLSTMESRYEKPWDSGSGPTRSIWINHPLYTSEYILNY